MVPVELNEAKQFCPEYVDYESVLKLSENPNLNQVTSI